VDLVVGQAAKPDLPALLHRVNPERFPAAPSPAAPEPPLPRFETTRALIKVQDGCGFGCAYCIVPRARGRPRSRPRAEILAEVRRLVDAGFREIVLTGANLGSYRDGEAGLPELTDRLEALPGLDRIRLSSIEITTAERAVIERMAASGKLCRFLHIPLQSGDDRILAAMGRRYTAAEYRRLIEYAAARVQPLGLGTDVIVGFPGEDGRAYRNTCALVDDLPFSNLHVFPYSRRPGTPAAEMPGQIPAPLARARVRELLILEARKRAAFAESFVGRRVEVLIERLEPDGTARGWTGEYLEVAVAGAGVRVNDLVTVAVTAAHGGGLRGATG
jgi:threonylcarbamoyladenosine tRNA methylthiotransferase MtaB